MITDKGSQFRAGSWPRYCRTRGIRPRYGAVGKHGSIAIVERFIRAMKTECTSRILVPLADDSMKTELALYAISYNEHRPHQALGGMTPQGVIECATAAPAPERSRPTQPFQMRVSYLEGRRHLPIVELQMAA